MVAGLATAMPTTLATADAVQARPTPKQEPLVVRVDGGFQWGDAAIGAAAGFGAAIALVGGTVLLRGSERAVIRPPLQREEEQ
jgi:hypothetical protein